MLKNVKCARCVKCGKEYEAVPDLTNCSCGGILDIIYDYDYIKKNLTKEKLKSRPNTMWRYRELLPVEVPPVLPLPEGLVDAADALIISFASFSLAGSFMT